jgi:type VI secretion system secreted protein VgrG
MFNHIFQVFRKPRASHKRALHIQFSNQYLNSQIFLQRIDGEHQSMKALKQNYLLSTNVTIPLKQFIGCHVAIDQ